MKRQMLLDKADAVFLRFCGLAALWFAGAVMPACAGNALDFEHDDGQYASIPLTLPDTGTIELWFQPESFYDYNTLFDNSCDGNDWEMWIGESGMLYFRIESSKLSYDLTSISGTNEWVHLAATWEKESDSETVDAALWVNGVVRDSLEDGAWTDPGDTFYLCGGHSANTTGDGLMEDVRIWSDVRTASEISGKLYAELSGGEDGLMAYFPMNQSSGTTLVDASANSYDGTLVNMSDDNWFLTDFSWSNLVAYYPFNGSGKDASGNSNDAVVTGCSVDGWMTQGKSTNEYAALPYTLFDGVSNFTFSAFGRLADTDTLYRHILSCAGTNSANELLVCYDTGNERWHFYCGGTKYIVATNAAMSDLAWHHVAVSASNSIYRLWLDGEELGSFECANSVLTVSEGGVFLGQDQDVIGGGFDADQSWNGGLDNVRIYHRALNSEQISALSAETHISYPITFSTSGNGAVAADYYWSAANSATVYVPSNTTLSVEAVPDDGWLFMEWGGGLSGDYSTSNTSFLVTSSNAFTALFSDDADEDGLLNTNETALGSDPRDSDSDDDGLFDGDEVSSYQTDPTLADTDGDGISDGDEVNSYQTDPTLSDTDGDGISDGAEIDGGSNPFLSNEALMASYPFSGSGKDASGNGNDAVVTGCSVDGWMSQGKSTNEYAALPYTLFDGVSNFTFSAFGRLADTDTLYRHILSCAGTNSANELLVCYDTGNERWHLYRGGTKYIVATNAAMSDLAWHHVVLSASNSIYRLWIDGEQVGSVAGTAAALSVSEGGVFLGQDQDVIGGGFDADQSWHGGLDNVCIYQRALSSAEVAELAEETYNGNTYYVAGSAGDDSSDGLSWNTARKTIQAAVNLTVDHDWVMVSNGTYSSGYALSPVDDWKNRVCITNSITVKSVNGPDVTVIDGLDAMRGVYLGGNTVFSGFTVTKGSASAEYWERNDYENFGGGICFGGDGIVSNCIISGNSAYYGGGVSGYSGGEVVDCTLSGNSASSYGGGSYYGTLTGCSVAQNTGSYGGGGSYYSTLTDCAVTGNTATHNGGGGCSYSTLTDCTLTGNTAAKYGGGCVESTLTGCTISSNSSTFGGGSLYSTLTNCTLSGNMASSSGGGCHSCTLTDCILFGNESEDSCGGSGSSTLTGCTLTRNSAATYGGGSGWDTLNNCIVWGNAGGTGSNTYAVKFESYSTTSDPCFTDAANGDYTLRLGSPCIDAGDNDYVTTDTDLAGNDRIVDGSFDGIGTVDIGAYEYQPDQTDSDDDGITDGDEVANGIDPLVSNEGVDSDDDGFSDYEEYVADTSMTNAGDYFSIDIDGNTVCFDSAEGRVYTVQVCTNLVEGGWSTVTNLSGTGTEALLSDPDEDKPEAFYRVQVELSE